MSQKIRINITIDPETRRLADRLARGRRVSRSAILREGVRALAKDQDRQAEEAARVRRQRQAVATMDRIARKLGDWPAERILRESRDRGWTK